MSLEKKHVWKYVILTKSGEKFFSDQVIGDHQEKGGSLVIVLTKTTGEEYRRTTVSNDSIESFSVATL